MKKPFLTVITRTIPTRKAFLQENRASLAAQSDPDYQQLIIKDAYARGVEYANGMMTTRDWSDVRGRYVMILDDDDMFHDPDLIATLKLHVDIEPPDLFMVRMDHGAWGVLPDAPVWQNMPLRGRQGCSSVIPARALFLRAVKHYQPRYDGDFDFVKACFDMAGDMLWLDVIATRTQQIGALTGA